MSTQAHTPGPWNIHGKFITAGPAIAICQFGSYTDECDAHLIAAAPDMLAALNHVIQWAQSRCPCEGEAPDPCPLCGATVKSGACKAVDKIFPKRLAERLHAAIAKAEGR